MLKCVKVLSDAGLRSTHVAELLDVSRNTVLNWYSGGMPHRWIIGQVHELSDAVKRAMEEGKLPISPSGMTAQEHSLKTYFTALSYFKPDAAEKAADRTSALLTAILARKEAPANSESSAKAPQAHQDEEGGDTT